MRIRCCLLALFLISDAARAQDMPLSQILIPGEEWKKIEGTFEPISSISPYRTDTKTLIVWDANRKVQAALDGEGKRIKPELPDLTNRPDMATPGARFAFALNPDKQSMKIVRFPSIKEVVNDFKLPLKEASALAITPDKGTLLIGDAASPYVWWFRINPDGELSAGEKYGTLRLRRGESRSETSAIRFDSAGRVYVAMKDGVQVFDPTGRLCGLLLNPSRERVSALAFGGEKGDQLFIGCGREIYRRKVSATWAFLESAKKK